MLQRFYSPIQQMFLISQSVCPWQTFPARYKNQTRLGILARDKDSSLLRKCIIYRNNKTSFIILCTGAKVFKFYFRNLQMFVKSQSVCPWQTFRPSVMFVDKAMSLSQSGGPERCFTQVGFGLTCKHQTRLERLAEVRRYLFAIGQSAWPSGPIPLVLILIPKCQVVPPMITLLLSGERLFPRSNPQL